MDHCLTNALSTELAAALLSFRYPSLLIKDSLNTQTASVLDLFYFNSVKFTYIDDNYDFDLSILLVTICYF